MISLSQLLLSVHVEQAGFALLELAGGASVRFGETDQLSLHYLLQGRASLSAPRFSADLATGDFVCVAEGAPHVLACGRAGAPQDFAAFQTLEPSDQLPRFRIGGDQRPSARLLSGSFRLSRREGAPLSALTPDVSVLRASGTRSSSLAPSPALLASLNGTGGGAFAAALMQTLLFQAVRFEVNRRLGDQPTDFSSLKHYKIATALRMMEREFDHDWTLDKFARSVGMSRSAFAADFQQMVGVPPIAHLTAIRMREARRRLEDGARLDDLVGAVGYRSAAALSRAFHRYFGSTMGALAGQHSAPGDRRLDG